MTASSSMSVMPRRAACEIGTFGASGFEAPGFMAASITDSIWRLKNQQITDTVTAIHSRLRHSPKKLPRLRGRAPAWLGSYAGASGARPSSSRMTLFSLFGKPRSVVAASWQRGRDGARPSSCKTTGFFRLWRATLRLPRRSRGKDGSWPSSYGSSAIAVLENDAALAIHLTWIPAALCGRRRTSSVYLLPGADRAGPVAN